LKVDDKEVTEYYHRGVVCHLIGQDLAIPLDAELQLPGEGDHAFKHEPTAIVNFVLTLFLAFVLLQCFWRRNLKPPLRDRFTLIALADELFAALVNTKRSSQAIPRARAP
jgi:hypothetical protein